MKLGSVYTAVLAEAAGATPVTAEDLTQLAVQMAGSSVDFETEIPDEEGERLLAKLRAQLPEIRLWFDVSHRRMIAEHQDPINRA